jgi:hypothetical protein
MTQNKVIGISMYGLEWVGRQGAVLESHPYLFLTKKGEEPFIFIQQNLHELNDFCVILFDGVKRKSLQEDDKIKSATNDAQDFDELCHIFDIKHFGYESLGAMYCPASALVMLYANLIRSLNIIARHYGEDLYESWQSRARGAQAEIPKLVELLERISGQKIDIFEQPGVEKVLGHHMRLLRNDFVHGKWEEVEKRLKGMSIRRCFEIVSSVFSFLEERFDERLLPRPEKLA